MALNRDDDYLKQGMLQGIGGVHSVSGAEQARMDQEDADRWNKSISMMRDAAKMRPDVSLGFSLGRLLFGNADKWFGHRRKDGTKHETAAGAAGTQEVQTPATTYDFSQFQTDDPMQMLANAGDSTAQYVLDAEKNQPSLMQPGQFGTDDYAQQNGINIQQNTFNPSTQETTSTTLSTNNPALLAGGPYFSMDGATGQGGMTFDPQQYGIEEGLTSNLIGGAGGEEGLMGSLLGDEEWWKKLGQMG